MQLLLSIKLVSNADCCFLSIVLNFTVSLFRWSVGCSIGIQVFASLVSWDFVTFLFDAVVSTIVGICFSAAIKGYLINHCSIPFIHPRSFRFDSSFVLIDIQTSQPLYRFHATTSLATMSSESNSSTSTSSSHTFNDMRWSGECVVTLVWKNEIVCLFLITLVFGQELIGFVVQCYVLCCLFFNVELRSVRVS